MDVTFQTIKIALKVELLRFFFSPIASPYLPKDNKTNMYIFFFFSGGVVPKGHLFFIENTCEESNE